MSVVILLSAFLSLSYPIDQPSEVSREASVHDQGR